MHWTERRRAKVKLAHGLRAAGWHLYGFKKDRSDPLSDAYDPESWAGIAGKGPYVAVVDVKPGNETLLKRSGGYKATRRLPGDDCPRCGGSGQEPEGWTYQQAKAQPQEFNLDRAQRQTPGAAPLVTQVVSPLCFDGQGRETCVRCGGRGHTWKLEEVRIDWPEFQANPPRKLWHVERDGRILDSGIGLGPCGDWDPARSQAAVERLVARIENARHTRYEEAAATGPEVAAQASPSTSSGPCIRRNLDKQGIEVVFPAKPAAEVRAGLKRLRFRWSRRQGLWYAPYSDTLWQQVHGLLQPGGDGHGQT